MNNEIAFGIGCYHFGINKKTPFNFNGNEYINELEKTLIKISNLNNLNIVCDDDFRESSFDITEQLPNIENDFGCFPQPLLLDIYFDLYIPYRIQSEIITTKEKFLTTYSENFRVRIINSYHLPVSIVEIIDPSETPFPSQAVQIVREFLRKEFIILKPDLIRFECLGPSPFPLDCYLRPSDIELDLNVHFDFQEECQRGYDNLKINYNLNKFENSEDALEYLLTSIRDEFGFHYMFVQNRNERMHIWESVETKVKKVIDLKNSKRLKGLLNKLFKLPGIIDEIYTDITSFEGRNIFNQRIFQNYYNNIFISKDGGVFKNFIDRALEEEYDYPVKQTTDLITFIESKRVKNLEIIIALFAAILGGTIGSLLTIYFKNI